ncbi:hypothetical protein J6590_021602 [Homalodisca vitripennis]|nr:hypothetical protein J6590_021602 [Homalodisca vitripennis]
MFGVMVGFPPSPPPIINYKFNAVQKIRGFFMGNNRVFSLACPMNQSSANKLNNMPSSLATTMCCFTSALGNSLSRESLFGYQDPPPPPTNTAIITSSMYSSCKHAL